MEALFELSQVLVPDRLLIPEVPMAFVMGVNANPVESLCVRSVWIHVEDGLR